MKLVNYLDVTLSLNNSNYKSYHKPDNEILYIHKDSTHPLSIHNHIPRSIEKILPYHLTKPYLTNQRKYIKKL